MIMERKQLKGEKENLSNFFLKLDVSTIQSQQSSSAVRARQYTTALLTLLMMTAKTMLSKRPVLGVTVTLLSSLSLKWQYKKKCNTKKKAVVRAKTSQNLYSEQENEASNIHQICKYKSMGWYIRNPRTLLGPPETASPTPRGPRSPV